MTSRLSKHDLDVARYLVMAVKGSTPKRFSFLHSPNRYSLNVWPELVIIFGICSVKWLEVLLRSNSGTGFRVSCDRSYLSCFLWQELLVTNVTLSVWECSLRHLLFTGKCLIMIASIVLPFWSINFYQQGINRFSTIASTSRKQERKSRGDDRVPEMRGRVLDLQQVRKL